MTSISAMSHPTAGKQQNITTMAPIFTHPFSSDLNNKNYKKNKKKTKN